MTFGTKLYDSVYTAGQPSESEFPELSRTGFRRIIDLRSRSENRGFDEPVVAALHQIEYVCLPIVTEADLNPTLVKKFDALLDNPNVPMTLVHCRSSNRVGALFALRAAWLQGLTFEAAIAIGRSAGLRDLEPTVRTAIAARANSA